MSKVLIAPMTLAGLDTDFVRILRNAGFELIYPSKAMQLTEDELLDMLQGVSASLAGSEPYTRRVIEACPALRVVARAGVGYDAVDTVACTERGVAVCIAPNTNQDAVAEHTFAIILAITKNVVCQHNGLCKGGWPRQANIPLRGRTLAIVGLGRIGKAVALRGKAFGMKLIAYEPFPDKTFAAEHGIKLVPLEQVFREGDFVSLHIPMSAESRYLVNKQTLDLMKPTAYLVNTARGGLVCEADLIAALRQRRIAGAALDVFEQEPPGKNPLFELDNVVVTPHAAGVDLQSRDDMALSAAEAIVSLSRGEWPAEKVVNPAVKERFRW